MVAPGNIWRHAAAPDRGSGLLSMKRKIAAIFAADIAGYSRLVAEDEEETLRRLASYRQVTDDFIAKGGGRIFNTAGDAVLAEFPSAVEAVRCAIDIQESLRTRNLAYPPSRQMNFRIGITVGDVVEQQVKNIPTAIHAYIVAMAQPPDAWAAKKQKPALLPATAMLAAVAVL